MTLLGSVERLGKKRERQWWRRCEVDRRVFRWLGRRIVRSLLLLLLVVVRLIRVGAPAPTNRPLRLERVNGNVRMASQW